MGLCISLLAIDCWRRHAHHNDVIMGTMTSQITSLSIVYSTVYTGADQIIHRSSASLAFVWGIHRWPVNFLHKRPVTWKMFPFDDVIMYKRQHQCEAIQWCCTRIPRQRWFGQYCYQTGGTDHLNSTLRGITSCYAYIVKCTAQSNIKTTLKDSKWT